MDIPDVVIVGAATRDLSDTDPRGWMAGGGVTYGALALSRMGLRVGVLLGLDEQARTARELDLIRDAGARIVEVPVDKGPVFRNIETPTGRIQLSEGPSDPVPSDALPEAWRRAPSWVLAPVASEVLDDWADAPPADACVAFAWQGALRRLIPGERVRPMDPGPSAIVRRADILSVSRHDIPGGLALRTIGGWMAPKSELLLTAGLHGGLLVRFESGGVVAARAYPSVPAPVEIDPTGAGDTMLAGLVAARVVAGPEARVRARDLHLGALAASLLVEGPGMDSVPTFARIRRRIEKAA
jgi:sugar/nucleoside kinase (ribokinase family)